MESELGRVVDALPGLVWTAFPDRQIDFLTQRLSECTRLGAEDSRSRRWQAAVHSEDLSPLLAAWRSDPAASVPIETDVRMHCRDATYRWFLFRAHLSVDAFGEVVKRCGLSSDIDERMRAEQARQASGRRFRLIIDVLSVLLSTAAPDRELDQANGHYLEYFGATLEELKAREVIHLRPVDLARVLPVREAAIEAGRPYEIESRYRPEDRRVTEKVTGAIRRGAPDFDYGLRLLIPDGSIKHVHVVAHGTPDGERRGLDYSGAAQDITQCQVGEAALDKARSELAHVTRVVSLGALTASIVPEVNQPLAGVLSNASTCLRMLTANQPKIMGAQETARDLICDDNRAAEAITGLLFSKKGAKTELVDPSEATRAVPALVSSDLPRNRVFLRPELDDHHPLLVSDRIQLQQVIFNLVRNAFDAMRDVNDRRRRLLVKAERDACASSSKTSAWATSAKLRQAVRRIVYHQRRRHVHRRVCQPLHQRETWRHAVGQGNDGPGTTFRFSTPRLVDSITGDRAVTPLRHPR